MWELLADPETYISLVMLSTMEIILGIDNIVFITILTGRLPENSQLLARRLGLGVAMLSRLLLLLAISWVIRLEEPLFHLIISWSGKDLILLGGGIFLVYKATHEIYENVERPHAHQPHLVEKDLPQPSPEAQQRLFTTILLQVMALDIVFSLDSVITAVGMVRHVPIMFAAIIIAVVIMMVFAGPVGDFVQKNPSVRILALAFLLLIGVMLAVESTGTHVAKGYIYSAMGFSLLVELMNMRRRSRSERMAASLQEAGRH